jgi:hypothetical protein
MKALVSILIKLLYIVDIYNIKTYKKGNLHWKNIFKSKMLQKFAVKWLIAAVYIVYCILLYHLYGGLYLLLRLLSVFVVGMLTILFSYKFVVILSFKLTVIYLLKYSQPCHVINRLNKIDDYVFSDLHFLKKKFLHWKYSVS